MRLSLPHPPESRPLLVAGSVCRIISGLDLREPLHADGVDLGDPVLERGALTLILDLAIPQSTFEGDELPLLESLGELREIPPGIDAVPFGAGFVVALIVLPALLGCDVEDDVLFVVLSGFGFCVLSEAADEGDLVEHGIWLRSFWFVCFHEKAPQVKPFLAAREVGSLSAGTRMRKASDSSMAPVVIFAKLRAE
jgi:hypothetical protein